MSRQTFETTNGSVAFNVDKMHGCCGAAVVYSVMWRRIVDRDAFYKEFHHHLKNATQPFDLDRCKVIMSDAVRKTHMPSIYNFCLSSDEWAYGDPSFNKKSGNEVIVFELNRQSSRSN